jgi:hypothetical protein
VSNKAVESALGIVTSVGGFLEIGSIATAAQAGGQFGFQLAWGRCCSAASASRSSSSSRDVSPQ